MIRFKSTLLALAILGFTRLSLAGTAGPWEFKTSTGLPAELTISVPLAKCSSDFSKNMMINVGSQKFEAMVCMDDPSRPGHLAGISILPNGQLNQGFYIYTGNEFISIMKQIAEFGNPSGPIGNAVNGRCPSGSDAFISLSGSLIGDPGFGGYCLIAH